MFSLFFLSNRLKSGCSSHKAIFTSGKRPFLYEIGTDPGQRLLETTYIFQRKQEQQYDPVTRFIKPYSVYHKNTCFILHNSLIRCILTSAHRISSVSHAKHEIENRALASNVTLYSWILFLPLFQSSPNTGKQPQGVHKH